MWFMQIICFRCNNFQYNTYLIKAFTNKTFCKFLRYLREDSHYTIWSCKGKWRSVVWRDRPLQSHRWTQRGVRESQARCAWLQNVGFVNRNGTVAVLLKELCFYVIEALEIFFSSWLTLLCTFAFANHMIATLGLQLCELGTTEDGITRRLCYMVRRSLSKSSTLPKFTGT